MITKKGVAGFTILLALCVIVFGAYVRLTDAGLGCPDWPGCYGFITVPETTEDYLSVPQHLPRMRALAASEMQIFPDHVPAVE